MKLSKQLSGIAGEYYAAAELSRRGLLAAITLRNSDSIDILASSIDGETQISVQVKTTQNKRKWPLSEKVEKEYSNKKIYIFINILNNKISRPEFFLIHSKDLAEHISKGHQKWLDTPGKKGKVHNPTKIREFSDISGKYLENWDLLDTF